MFSLMASLPSVFQPNTCHILAALSATSIQNADQRSKWKNVCCICSWVDDKSINKLITVTYRNPRFISKLALKCTCALCPHHLWMSQLQKMLSAHSNTYSIEIPLKITYGIPASFHWSCIPNFVIYLCTYFAEAEHKKSRNNYNYKITCLFVYFSKRRNYGKYDDKRSRCYLLQPRKGSWLFWH